MKILKTLAVAVGIATCAVTAMAQNYPDKPIKIVVPFPAGGGTDNLTRMIANAVNVKYGWTIVVENKPGAGGNLA